MYTRGDIDIEKLTAEAREYVLRNDRKAFLPVLRRIERFAQSRKMIIGGRIGSRALLSAGAVGSIDMNMWALDLYSADIEKDMRDCLADVTQFFSATSAPAPAPESSPSGTSQTEPRPARVKENPDDIYNGDPRSFVLRPTFPGREYRMWADFRNVANGYSLGERKGIDIVGIIAPTIAAGLFGTRDVLLMPRDMQIMICAHSICNPGFASDWAQLFAQLCDLFSLNPRNGGFARNEGAKGAKGAKARFILEDGILVGEYAVEYYVGEKIAKDTRARPQYLCSFEGLDDYVAREKMTARFIDVRAPDDFRARKMILRNRNGDIVADLFNAPSYEVVPVNDITGGTKARKYARLVASPFAVLRFLFVEIWALAFVIEMAHDGADSLRKRQNFLRAIASKLFGWILAARDKDVDTLFPATYMGIYIPEGAAKRKQMMGKFQGPMSTVDTKKLMEIDREIVDRLTIV
jgi:hypothetical protein